MGWGYINRVDKLTCRGMDCFGRLFPQMSAACIVKHREISSLVATKPGSGI